MSAPCRWCGESAPSPVLCSTPAMAAPLLSASTAGPESDPKLIAEMLATELGRNFSLRSRSSPSTLAEGIGTSSPTWIAVVGATSEKVRCLMIG
jgi:hypothetical protein